MSKHTPGPWREYSDEFDLHIVAHNPQWLGEREVICGLSPGPNARLIAEAPELLRMLQVCASFISAYPGTEKLHAEIEAAIARAKGTP